MDASPQIGSPDAAGALADYYLSEAVRARILEYCGAPDGRLESASARRIAGFGGRRGLQQEDGAPVVCEKTEIFTLWSDGADICRSLADAGGTLLQLDIDYVNPKDPAEPYASPRRIFGVLEPVYRTALARFLRWGIRPLTLVTGRGYHLTARVPSGGAFHEALVEIGNLSAPLQAHYESDGGAQAVLQGRGHEGAGRVMELLAHDVIRRVSGRTIVPVTLGDVPSLEGPFVCLDLSAHGDPLFERSVRCAFSGHQKAHLRGLSESRPFVICLPRQGTASATILNARDDPAAATRLASRTTALIPDVRAQEVRWIEDYRRSRLAAFHREFERGTHDLPESWPSTYDRLDLLSLPACVRLPLEVPNPFLLQPRYLRVVALSLWAMGWHPRAIGGLIRSKFERDHGWGALWYRYCAAQRADFYVRLFCGAIACGLEAPLQFSCESEFRRGVCPAMGRCGHDLEHLSRRIAPTEEVLG